MSGSLRSRQGLLAERITCILHLRCPCPASTPVDRRASAGAMVEGLAQSLALGHWKVALRRYAMLVARGEPVPAGLRQRCDRLLLACGEVEFERLLERVGAWMQCMAGHWNSPVRAASPRLPRDSLHELHAAFRPFGWSGR